MRYIGLGAICAGLLMLTAVVAEAAPALYFVFPTNGQIIYGKNAMLWVGGLPVETFANAPTVVFEASTDKKKLLPIPQAAAPDMGLGSRTTALDSTAFPVGKLYLRARYADREAGPITRLTQNVTCAATAPYPTNADFALSGNWFGGAATSGQGFTAEVNPNSGAFFSAWYTYMPNGSAAGAAGIQHKVPLRRACVQFP